MLDGGFKTANVVMLTVVSCCRIRQCSAHKGAYSLGISLSLNLTLCLCRYFIESGAMTVRAINLSSLIIFRARGQISS